MLKMKANDILVLNLRVILLLEVDFNILNKIIFNSCLILTLEKRNLMLREIIRGRRNQSTLHIALNKKLIVDISNQSKILYAIASANTFNYFNYIMHLIIGLICQFFRLLVEMEICLIIAYQRALARRHHLITVMVC